MRIQSSSCLAVLVGLLIGIAPAALAQDLDGDGWSVAGGDCCDVPSGGCVDPELVNPGAYDLANGIDDDCDGTIDNGSIGDCSVSTVLNPTAIAVANALDICQTTSLNPPLSQRTWGLIGAELLRATGANVPSVLQAAVMMTYGVNGPAGNGTMAVLSTGRARDASHPGFVPPEPGQAWGDPVPAPADFVAANGGLYHTEFCPPSLGTIVHDSVRLRLVLRVPTNANGFQFSHRYFSSQYPDVCEPYNDHLIGQLTSGYPVLPPDRNILYGSNNEPVTDQTANFLVCTPNPPDFPCSQGPGELSGTGYQNTDAATSWATSVAPVLPGETITLEFIIWDTDDQLFDALALIDNFRWTTITQETGVGDPPTVASGLFLGARPNPFVRSASIDFSLPVAGRVALGVFDVAGRLVRRLADGEYTAGPHTVAWDGKDDAGQRVFSGAYFVRLQAGDRQIVKRVVLEN